MYTSDSYMSALAKGEDTDEMQHNATFHQGHHCLLKQNISVEKELLYNAIWFCLFDQQPNCFTSVIKIIPKFGT